MKHLVMTTIGLILCYSSLSSQNSWTKLSDAYYANDPRDITVATSDGYMYVIGGASRTLLKSTNQGDSWTTIGPSNVFCVAAKPDDSQVILVGINNGGSDFKVMRTGNGGGSWTDVITPSGGGFQGLAAPATKIAFSSVNTMNVLVGAAGFSGSYGTKYQVFKSTDGGITFSGSGGSSFKKQCTISDIKIDANEDAYITAYDLDPGHTERGVWRNLSPFGTGSWSPRNGVTGAQLVNKNIAALAINPNDGPQNQIYCATYENISGAVFTLYHSTDQGGHWYVSPSTSPSSNKARSVRTLGGFTFVATVAGIYRATTGSNPSYTLASGSGLMDKYCQSLATYSTNFLFCGTAGSLYRSTDAAANFTEIINGMAMAKPTAILKVGNSSTLLMLSSISDNSPGALIHRSLDGGATWQVVQGNLESPSGKTLLPGSLARGASGVSIASATLVGLGGPRVLRSTSTDNGTNWASIDPTGAGGPGSASQVAYDPVSTATLFIAGQISNQSPAGRVFKSVDDGATWTPRSLPSGAGEMKAVVVGPTQVVYAGGVGGVFKSTDGGSSWNAANCGLPANPIVNALSINVINPLKLVAGLSNASTYQTTDGAGCWSPLQMSPSSTDNIASVYMHPLNPGCVYVSGTTGGPTPFFRKSQKTTVGTYNEYGTIPTTASVSQVVADPGNAYTVYAATSAGGYKKTHQWIGDLESDLAWYPGQDIQIGAGATGTESTLPTLTVPSGIVLTVNPGAVLKFLNYSGLSATGTLTSRGDAAPNIITYQPLDPGSGNWNGVQISSGGQGAFKYCSFLRGGDENNTRAALRVYTDNPVHIDNSTFRDCAYAGYVYQTTLASRQILASFNRVIGTNVHPTHGVYFYNSVNVGMDNCYITGCSTIGIRIDGGNPGFHADTVEGNAYWSTFSFRAGVYCLNSSPEFAGFNEANEPGNNVIRNNDNIEVYASTANPLFGNATMQGYNMIYDVDNGTRVYTSSGATVSAQYTYWGACPPSPSWFLGGGIDYSNCLTYPAPALAAPADYATNLPYNHVTVSWNAVTPTPTYYELQYANNPNYNPITYQYLYISSQFTSVSGIEYLQPNTFYYWRVRAKGDLGYGPWSERHFTTGSTPSAHPGGDSREVAIPTAYDLDQNFPNPFNPTTRFDYALPEEARVTLTIFDVVGREVQTLVDNVESAGYKSVEFDATTLPSGIYFYRLQAGTFTAIKKMILMK